MGCPILMKPFAIIFNFWKRRFNNIDILTIQTRYFTFFINKNYLGELDWYFGAGKAHVRMCLWPLNKLSLLLAYDTRWFYTRMCLQVYPFNKHNKIRWTWNESRDYAE